MGGETREEQASMRHLGFLGCFDFLTMNENSERQQ